MIFMEAIDYREKSGGERELKARWNTPVFSPGFGAEPGRIGTEQAFQRLEWGRIANVAQGAAGAIL
jgi:hypothetical protein